MGPSGAAGRCRRARVATGTAESTTRPGGRVEASAGILSGRRSPSDNSQAHFPSLRRQKSHTRSTRARSGPRETRGPAAGSGRAGEELAGGDSPSKRGRSSLGRQTRERRLHGASILSEARLSSEVYDVGQTSCLLGDNARHDSLYCQTKAAGKIELMRQRAPVRRRPRVAQLECTSPCWPSSFRQTDHSPEVAGKADF